MINPDRYKGSSQYPGYDRFVPPGSSNPAGSGNDTATALVAFIEEPASYKEAMASPNAAQWSAACDEEFTSLMINGTWTLEEVPYGVKPIPTNGRGSTRPGAGAG